MDEEHSLISMMHEPPDALDDWLAGRPHRLNDALIDNGTPERHGGHAYPHAHVLNRLPQIESPSYSQDDLDAHRRHHHDIGTAGTPATPAGGGHGFSQPIPGVVTAISRSGGHGHVEDDTWIPDSQPSQPNPIGTSSSRSTRLAAAGARLSSPTLRPATATGRAHGLSSSTTPPLHPLPPSASSSMSTPPRHTTNNNQTGSNLTTPSPMPQHVDGLFDSMLAAESRRTADKQRDSLLAVSLGVQPSNNHTPPSPHHPIAAGTGVTSVTVVAAVAPSNMSSMSPPVAAAKRRSQEERDEIALLFNTDTQPLELPVVPPPPSTSLSVPSQLGGIAMGVQAATSLASPPRPRSRSPAKSPARPIGNKTTFLNTPPSRTSAATTAVLTPGGYDSSALVLSMPIDPDTELNVLETRYDDDDDDDDKKQVAAAPSPLPAQSATRVEETIINVDDSDKNVVGGPHWPAIAAPTDASSKALLPEAIMEIGTLPMEGPFGNAITTTTTTTLVTPPREQNNRTVSPQPQSREHTSIVAMDTTDDTKRTSSNDNDESPQRPVPPRGRTQTGGIALFSSRASPLQLPSASSSSHSISPQRTVRGNTVAISHIGGGNNAQHDASESMDLHFSLPPESASMLHTQPPINNVIAFGGNASTTTTTTNNVAIIMGGQNSASASSTINVIASDSPMRSPQQRRNGTKTNKNNERSPSVSESLSSGSGPSPARVAAGATVVAAIAPLAPPAPRPSTSVTPLSSSGGVGPWAGLVPPRALQSVSINSGATVSTIAPLQPSLGTRVVPPTPSSNVINLMSSSTGNTTSSDNKTATATVVVPTQAIAIVVTGSSQELPPAVSIPPPVVAAVDVPSSPLSPSERTLSSVLMRQNTIPIGRRSPPSTLPGHTDGPSQLHNNNNNPNTINNALLDTQPGPSIVPPSSIYGRGDPMSRDTQPVDLPHSAAAAIPVPPPSSQLQPRPASPIAAAPLPSPLLLISPTRPTLLSHHLSPSKGSPSKLLAVPNRVYLSPIEDAPSPSSVMIHDGPETTTHQDGEDVDDNSNSNAARRVRSRRKQRQAAAKASDTILTAPAVLPSSAVVDRTASVAIIDTPPASVPSTTTTPKSKRSKAPRSVFDFKMSQSSQPSQQSQPAAPDDDINENKPATANDDVVIVPPPMNATTPNNVPSVVPLAHSIVEIDMDSGSGAGAGGVATAPIAGATTPNGADISMRAQSAASLATQLPPDDMMMHDNTTIATPPAPIRDKETVRLERLAAAQREANQAAAEAEQRKKEERRRRKAEHKAATHLVTAVANGVHANKSSSSASTATSSNNDALHVVELVESESQEMITPGQTPSLPTPPLPPPPPRPLATAATVRRDDTTSSSSSTKKKKDKSRGKNKKRDDDSHDHSSKSIKTKKHRHHDEADGEEKGVHNTVIKEAKIMMDMSNDTKRSADMHRSHSTSSRNSGGSAARGGGGAPIHKGGHGNGNANDHEEFHFWIGDPVRMAEGRIYYHSIKLGYIHKAISVGDFVLMHSPTELPYIGEVICMWQDTFNRMWMRSNFFYRPEDLPNGRIGAKHGWSEVMKADHEDDNRVEVIEGITEVIYVDAEGGAQIPSQFKGKTSSKRSSGGSPTVHGPFYCRLFYHRDTERTSPLSMEKLSQKMLNDAAAASSSATQTENDGPLDAKTAMAVAAAVELGDIVPPPPPKRKKKIAVADDEEEPQITDSTDKRLGRRIMTDVTAGEAVPHPGRKPTSSSAAVSAATAPVVPTSSTSIAAAKQILSRAASINEEPSSLPPLVPPPIGASTSLGANEFDIATGDVIDPLLLAEATATALTTASTIRDGGTGETNSTSRIDSELPSNVTEADEKDEKEHKSDKDGESEEDDEHRPTNVGKDNNDSRRPVRNGRGLKRRWSPSKQAKLTTAASSTTTTTAITPATTTIVPTTIAASTRSTTPTTTASFRRRRRSKETPATTITEPSTISSTTPKKDKRGSKRARDSPTKTSSTLLVPPSVSSSATTSLVAPSTPTRPTKPKKSSDDDFEPEKPRSPQKPTTPSSTSSRRSSRNNDNAAADTDDEDDTDAVSSKKKKDRKSSKDDENKSSNAHSGSKKKKEKSRKAAKDQANPASDDDEAPSKSLSKKGKSTKSSKRPSSKKSGEDDDFIKGKDNEDDEKKKSKKKDKKSSKSVKKDGKKKASKATTDDDSDDDFRHSSDDDEKDKNEKKKKNQMKKKVVNPFDNIDEMGGSPVPPPTIPLPPRSSPVRPTMTTTTNVTSSLPLPPPLGFNPPLLRSTTPTPSGLVVPSVAAPVPSPPMASLPPGVSRRQAYKERMLASRAAEAAAQRAKILPILAASTTTSGAVQPLPIGVNRVPSNDAPVVQSSVSMPQPQPMGVARSHSTSTVGTATAGTGGTGTSAGGTSDGLALGRTGRDSDDEVVAVFVAASEASLNPLLLASPLESLSGVVAATGPPLVARASSTAAAAEAALRRSSSATALPATLAASTIDIPESIVAPTISSTTPSKLSKSTALRGKKTNKRTSKEQTDEATSATSNNKSDNKNGSSNRVKRARNGAATPAVAVAGAAPSTVPPSSSSRSSRGNTRRAPSPNESTTVVVATSVIPATQQEQKTVVAPVTPVRSSKVSSSSSSSRGRRVGGSEATTPSPKKRNNPPTNGMFSCIRFLLTGLSRTGDEVSAIKKLIKRHGGHIAELHDMTAAEARGEWWAAGAEPSEIDGAPVLRPNPPLFNDAPSTANGTHNNNSMTALEWLANVRAPADQSGKRERDAPITAGLPTRRLSIGSIAAAAAAASSPSVNFANGSAPVAPLTQPSRASSNGTVAAAPVQPSLLVAATLSHPNDGVDPHATELAQATEPTVHMVVPSSFLTPHRGVQNGDNINNSNKRKVAGDDTPAGNSVIAPPSPAIPESPPPAVSSSSNLATDSKNGDGLVAVPAKKRQRKSAAAALFDALTPAFVPASLSQADATTSKHKQKTQQKKETIPSSIIPATPQLPKVHPLTEPKGYPSSVGPYRLTVVLAPKAMRTVKYVVALARGVAPITLSWLDACDAQGRLIPALEYALPSGDLGMKVQHIPTRFLRPRKGLLPSSCRDRIFGAMHTSVVVGSLQFCREWRVALWAAGIAHVYCVTGKKGPNAQIGEDDDTKRSSTSSDVDDDNDEDDGDNDEKKAIRKSTRRPGGLPKPKPVVPDQQQSSSAAAQPSEWDTWCDKIEWHKCEFALIEADYHPTPSVMYHLRRYKVSLVRPRWVFDSFIGQRQAGVTAKPEFIYVPTPKLLQAAERSPAAKAAEEEDA
jgi:hypothetical protein